MLNRWSACCILWLVPVLVACEDVEPLPSPEPTEKPKTVKGATPARVAEASDLLTDLARWDAASSAARKHAAELVDGKLSDFTLQRLEWFESGDQRHEVAIFLHATTGMEFSLAPAGLAVTDAEHQEGVQIEVFTPFLVARTEVTRRQWELVTGSPASQLSEEPLRVEIETSPLMDADAVDALRKELTRQVSSSASATVSADAQLPVESVRPQDAVQWCRLAGLELPTYQQWEYACRAGTKAAYCFGDDPERAEEYVWYVSNAGKKVHRVGEKLPNAFGLFDLHGNAWEWCEDTLPVRGDEPIERHALRGGNIWYPDPTKCSGKTFRFAKGVDTRFFNPVGFRPVRNFSWE